MQQRGRQWQRFAASYWHDMQTAAFCLCCQNVSVHQHCAAAIMQLNTQIRWRACRSEDKPNVCKAKATRLSLTSTFSSSSSSSSPSSLPSLSSSASFSHLTKGAALAWISLASSLETYFLDTWHQSGQVAALIKGNMTTAVLLPKQCINYFNHLRRKILCIQQTLFNVEITLYL